MAKKKATTSASFQYFADGIGNDADAQQAASAAARTEDEQVAENVRIFLEKRPPSPWLKPEDKPVRPHPVLALPTEESS